MHGRGLTHGVSLVPFAYVTLVEKGLERARCRDQKPEEKKSRGLASKPYSISSKFYQLEYPYETDSFRQIRVFLRTFLQVIS